MKPDIIYRPGKPSAKPKGDLNEAAITKLATAIRKDAASSKPKLTIKPTHVIIENGGRRVGLAVQREAMKKFQELTAPKPKAKAKRKSRAPKAFNRDEYQALYMRDRREADAAGFGPGPHHKTVKQYREWKSHQKDTT